MDAEGRPHTDETSLDPSVLETLREALDDDELLTEVIQTFLDETPTHLASLTAAARSGDAPAVTAAAHLVKGSALTLGAVRLGRMCAALEASPAERLAEGAVQEFEQVSQRLDRFVATLRGNP